MAKIKYASHRFGAESLSLIEIAETICDEYAADDYVITLRQLYYQFVARGHLENTKKSYDRLGSIINDARLAGLIDWKHLEDRTRNLQGNSHWTSPRQILESCHHSFKLDKWATQDHYVEVWVEKEALAGVIERAARGLDVSFFSCRGYVSQSEMHAAALRFNFYNKQGRAVRVIHLGDHDPSGIDMSRDIVDRMAVFGVKNVRVDRIALNMPQVEQYNPPPNPAKTTDGRFAAYQKKFGDESWELDALEPKVLEVLINDAVKKYQDEDKYSDLLRKETSMRYALKLCCDKWSDVAKFLKVPDAAEGLKIAEYDEDSDMTGLCTCPDCESEDDEDKNVYRDGVCRNCHDRGWLQCSDCYDHMQSDYATPGPDGEALCLECFGQSCETCPDCRRAVLKGTLDEGRCAECNDDIDDSDDEEPEA